MMKEMNSMKEFDVHDEVLVKDSTEEQVNESLDCRWRMLRRMKRTACLPRFLHW